MKATPQMKTIVATLPITIPAIAPDDNDLLLGSGAALVLEDLGFVVTVVEATGMLLPTPASVDVIGVVVVSRTVLVYPEIVAQP